MATLYLTLGFLALFFVMMSVRLIFLKNGEFKGTCASQNPLIMEKGIDCACGKKAPVTKAGSNSFS